MNRFERCLPVIIIAAIDARLTGEAGQGRVEGPSAFVATEALTVPRLIDGHQVESIGDGVTASRTQCHGRYGLLLFLFFRFFLLDGIDMLVEAVHHFVVIVLGCLERLFLLLLLLGR